MRCGRSCLVGLLLEVGAKEVLKVLVVFFEAVGRWVEDLFCLFLNSCGGLCMLCVRGQFSLNFVQCFHLVV